MITITTTIDTDEHGSLKMTTQALGMGSEDEKVMAHNMVEVARSIYELTLLAKGAIPETKLTDLSERPERN